jgi:hypothetical protein
MLVGMEAAVRRVSLTVDATAGLDVEPVLALFEGRGLAATVYVDPVRLLERPQFWRDTLAKGHEVGNGTLLAASSLDGRLERWTTDMILAELEETRALWAEVLGDAPWSLGIPFGERTAHDGEAYLPAVRAAGVPTAATDAALGIAVWSAQSSEPHDLEGGAHHVVELARGPDNRPFWRLPTTDRWLEWAARQPRGAVLPFVEAYAKTAAAPER